MKRYRCDISDKYSIAQFVLAKDIQEANELAKARFGNALKSVTYDGEATK